MKWTTHNSKVRKITTNRMKKCIYLSLNNWSCLQTIIAIPRKSKTIPNSDT